MLVEQMAIVLAGLLVPGPDAVFHRGKDRLDGVVRLVGPDVIVAVRRVAVAARLLEPLVLAGGVLHQQFDDHVQAQLLGLFQQRDHVGQVAETGGDLQVVGDVVAGIAERRSVAGHDPHRGGAQPTNVVQAFGDAAQIATAVAVAVAEQGRVDLIDHRVAIPEWAHAQLSAGRRINACPAIRVPVKGSPSPMPSLAISTVQSPLCGQACAASAKLMQTSRRSSLSCRR